MGRDEIGQRSETVRRANLSAIVRELHARGPLSRSELVAATGLTRSAIRSARSANSSAADLVIEERPALARHARTAVAARPPQRRRRRRPRARDRGRLAGRRHRRPGWRGLRTAPGRPSARRIPRSTTIVADLAELATERPRPAGRTRPIIGVGVAVVGVVRRSDGFVSMAPNLGWRDVPLGARLARALGDRRADLRSPTTPTSARSPSCAAARPSAPTTSCTSRARSASAAA